MTFDSLVMKILEWKIKFKPMSKNLKFNPKSKMKTDSLFWESDLTFFILMTMTTAANEEKKRILKRNLTQISLCWHTVLNGHVNLKYVARISEWCQTFKK